MRTLSAPQGRQDITGDLVAKGDLVVDAADYGVTTSGDVTTSVATAIAATVARGSDAKLYIRPGTYTISGTITIPCSIDASQATFNYSGTGTALLVGTDTSGSVISRKRFDLPRVVCATRPGTGWDGSSRGVVISNCNDCEFDVPFVQDFEQGLVFYGKAAGTAYCKVMLGSLWNNHRQMIFDHDATGWANQNTIVGGRLQQVLTGSNGSDDTSANQLLLGWTGSASPNQNTFVGTSFEGDNPAYYKVDCNGRYNYFVNCRWEPMTGPCRVRWRAGSHGNTIDCGYEAHLIEEVYVSGSANNELRSRFGAYITASNTSGQTIPYDGTTAFETITGWSSVSQYGATYNSGSGTWTPRQGRWRISANVSLASTTGSAIIRALVAGTSTLDLAAGPVNASGATMYKLAGTYYFSGTQSLALQVRKETTPASNRTLATTVGYVELRAEYAGPA